MKINKLHRVCIVTKQEDIFNIISAEEYRLWVKEMKRNNLEVVLTQSLKEMGIYIRGKENSLFISDSDEILIDLKAKDCYIVAWEHGNQKVRSFTAKLAFQDLLETDADFFEKCFERLAGIPWKIAETKRLLIREMCEEDLELLYTIYRDPEITYYTENLYEDREKERQYIRDYIRYIYSYYGYGTWLLFQKETGELVGRAGLNPRPGFDETELGFLIAKKFWRQGYATEACLKIIEIAGNVFEMARLQALVEKENTASVSLLKKLNFQYYEDVEIDHKKYRRYLLEMSHSD